MWEWFPFCMLMLLAALQMMPSEPLEAARIDGAGGTMIMLPVVAFSLLVRRCHIRGRTAGALKG